MKRPGPHRTGALIPELSKGKRTVPESLVVALWVLTLWMFCIALLIVGGL